MSQIGKFLNLHPHMQSWAVYNENGPYTKDHKKGDLAPAQFGGLSYMILDEKGSDVYVIQTESFGKCAIWAPADNDSNITFERMHLNGDSNGSGGGSLVPGTGTGKYLNLKPHMQTWAVYNVDGPYTTDYKKGDLAPAQFGGLSYGILEEKGGDIYIIQTESFGRCAIWAPRDPDSSITTSPEYSNGDTSGGGSTGGGSGTFLNLKPHMQTWAVYNVDGPYTKDYKIGDVLPAKFGGLSYRISEEKGGDIYIIQTESFGRCAIWAPRDPDSSITTSPEYSNGDTSGGGSTGGGSGTFLNLKPHMQSWAVYNINGPYTKDYKIGDVLPAKFGGLSYRILEEKGGDIYIIQTESCGRCAIWAPRDPDSSITSSPEYSNGDTSGGGSTGGGTGGDIGTGDPSFRVYSRYEWGAKPIIPSGMSGERTRPFRYIIVHHSAAEQFNSDIAQMQSIQNYHQSLDWGDIGYHYGIGKFGMTMQGRETKYVGAHTKGERNSDSIGICLFGNFESSSPSQFQINSLVSLLTRLCKQYGLSPDSIYGHKDFNPTGCPGRYLYAFLPNIIDAVRKNINNASAIEEINKLGFAKKFGVEFATTGEEILIAQSGAFKLTLQNSDNIGSDEDDIILNVENGKIVGGTYKTKLADFAIKLAEQFEISVEKTLLELGNYSTSISVASTSKTISVSFTQSHKISNNRTLKQILKIEFDKDEININPTAAAENLVEYLRKVLGPFAIIITILALIAVCIFGGIEIFAGAVATAVVIFVTSIFNSFKNNGSV